MPHKHLYNRKTMKKIVKGDTLMGRMDVEERLRTRAIKSTAFMHGGVVTKGELSARHGAEAVIAVAQKEAEAILLEAQQVLSQVHQKQEEAKQKGFEEGKEQGMGEVTEEVVRARVLKEKFLEENEPEILRLVVSIAEKVIGQTVLQHKDVFREVIRQALEKSLGDRIVVRVHPEDLARLTSEDLTFKGVLDKTRQIHFREDASIERGGCIVETEIGTIDAQLEVQLKAIKKALGV